MRNVRDIQRDEKRHGRIHQFIGRERYKRRKLNGIYE